MRFCTAFLGPFGHFCLFAVGDADLTNAEKCAYECGRNADENAAGLRSRTRGDRGGLCGAGKDI